MPEVEGFNRIDFTPLHPSAVLVDPRGGAAMLAGDEIAAAMPLRNVRIAWVSDPDGFEASQRLNLYGFRGPDFRVAKTPGRRRLIFLGDSFVEGFGVADDETVPRRFEVSLGDGSEVLNLGVGSMQVPDVVALARTAIPLLRPDVVFVLYYQNDFPVNARMEADPRKRIVPRRRGLRFLRALAELREGSGPALRWPRGPTPFFQPVPHPSNPLTAGPAPRADPEILEAMRAGRFNPWTRSDPVRFAEHFSQPLGPRRIGRGQQEALIEFCRTAGAELVVGFVPMHLVVHDGYRQAWNRLGDDFPERLDDPRYRETQRSLARFFGKRGVPFVDLSDAIATAEAAGTRLYHAYDAHLNAEGTALVGAELARRFREGLPSQR